MKTPNHTEALCALCPFLEKLYTEKKAIFVRTENDEQSKSMDKLLWTFRDESFIPHEIITENKVGTAPILLGDLSAKPPLHRDVLVNLTRETPPFYLEYASIVEIVLDEETEKNRQRDTYKFYQSRQAIMKTLRS